MRIGENQWESLRIGENHQESLRILKLGISSFQPCINYVNSHEDSTDLHQFACANHCESLWYMVGKRRFSALKWHLVYEHWLRIEATGAILIFCVFCVFLNSLEFVSWCHFAKWHCHDHFRLIWESLRINFRLIWESLRISFRLIWESPRVIKNQFQTYSRIIENQWESVRIIKNWQESLRIIENWQESVFKINENQFQTYSRISENHQELARITENHQ